MQEPEPQYISHELCSNGAALGIAILVAQLFDLKFPRTSESERKSDGRDTVLIDPPLQPSKRGTPNAPKLEHLSEQGVQTVKNNVNRSKHQHRDDRPRSRLRLDRHWRPRPGPKASS